MAERDLLAELARLQEENAALKAKRSPKPSFKVGEKGGVSVYSISTRFPITLYRSQWERLIAVIPELQEFIAANASKLSVKAEK